MTISFPLSLPSSYAPASLEFGGSDIIGVNKSPFNNSEEIQDWNGDSWAVKMSWPTLASRERAAPFIARLMALRGRKGSILLGDPLGKTARGLLGGTPVVNGAHAAGVRTLGIKGLTHNVAGWIKEADYLQVGTGEATRLHLALADANSDNSGLLTVDIWPCLREALADSAPITMANCQGTFRLATNKRGWSSSRSAKYALTLDFVEKP